MSRAHPGVSKLRGRGLLPTASAIASMESEGLLHGSLHPDCDWKVASKRQRNAGNYARAKAKEEARLAELAAAYEAVDGFFVDKGIDFVSCEELEALGHSPAAVWNAISRNPRLSLWRLNGSFGARAIAKNESMDGGYREPSPAPAV